MKSAGKLVPFSANKINVLKPIIIPVPTLIPNPNMSSTSIVVNKFLAYLIISTAIPTDQHTATAPNTIDIVT